MRLEQIAVSTILFMDGRLVKKALLETQCSHKVFGGLMCGQRGPEGLHPNCLFMDAKYSVENLIPSVKLGYHSKSKCNRTSLGSLLSPLDYDEHCTLSFVSV